MNKSLIVTGASSDMGIAFLEQYGYNYDNIVSHYRNMNEKLSKVLEKLKVKVDISLWKCDFTQMSSDTEESKKLLGDIVGRLKGTEIHLVHFAASTFDNNRYYNISWDVFQRDIEVSLKSFVIISQMILPMMVKVKKGKIVLMLSYVCENIPPKYCSNYVAVKYALLGLMRSLAVEYADKGITVNGISPATVDTKFISNWPDVLVQSWMEKNPLGRNLTVEEVIPTIQFLLSSEADCINGENILISCGMGAHG